MLIDGIGWIDSVNGEIRTFEENGEMARVKWYGQGKQTFNGKYVISIIYE
jgi:hypothetical protein